MSEQFRLGAGDLYEEKHKHVHPRTFATEATTGPERLRIGVDGIDTLRALTAALPGPFWLMVIMIAERVRPTGRYGTREPLERAELDAFFDRFGDLFSTDGRHELWVQSAQEFGLLVYDPHEIVYAYGDLDRFRGVLTEHGYTPGEVVIPMPHMHYYHAENDEAAEGLLASRDWTYDPLTEDDEERAEA